MSELQKFLKKQTDKLPNISSRKLYGLDSFYLNEKPYIVIAANEQIVIKVEDFEVKKNILKMTHATPWKLDDKVMPDWFVLPVTFNKKKSKLNPILEMTSKTLLHPRKNKKKHSKKAKVQKQEPVAKTTLEVGNSSSIFKTICNFFTQK